MKSVRLNNDIKMPIIGFGVYQIVDQYQCEKSVNNALMTGYRLIDTAAAYKNEEAVGKAVKKSGIPRDEIFITTKLWVQDTGYEKTKNAFEKSINRLNIDYLDLYLIHQPFGDVYGSWRAMEELYEDGKIRAIGVSNFYSDRLVDFVIHNKITPAVNQVETHPFCQQIESAEIMKENSVQIESWAPFAEGKNNIFQNEILQVIGDKYEKTIAQVILRWLIQRGIIVIPKSVHKNRIIENFSVFDFELTNEDMNQISTLDTKKSCFFSHRDPKMVKKLGEINHDDI
ncbi:MAG: aldo/keto reductase [Candidatus Heimdallarchaeota archaeon]|nr:MAG: aldo/keto reductase [Candidatus Heimdallarchaeota archaeon]